MTNEQYWFKQFQIARGNTFKDFLLEVDPRVPHLQQSFVLEEEIAAEIRQLSANSPYGIYIYFLAALTIVLEKYTGSNELTIATPSFKMESKFDLSGFLLINVDLVNLGSVKDLFNLLRREILKIIEYQEYDNSKLQTLIQEAQSSSTLTQKIDVVLAYDELHYISRLNFKCPLQIEIKDEGGKFILTYSFTESFHRSFIAQFLNDFQVICRSGLKLLMGQLNAVSLASSTFQPQQYSDSTSSAILPESINLLDEFYENVRATPLKPAIYFQGTQLSYQELSRKALSISRYSVNKRYIVRGDIVAISMESSFELVIAMIAVIRSGGVVLFLDKSLPPDRVHYLIKKSKCKLALCDYEMILDDIIQLDIHQIHEDKSQADISFDSIYNDSAFIVYTSGSTGEPKGVLLSHSNLINQFVWFRDYFNLTDNDVLPQKASITFVDCLTELLFPITYGRSAIYLRPNDRINSDSKLLEQWLREINVSILLFVPSAFEFYYQAIGISSLNTLRHLVLGGEELTEKYDFPFNVYNLYGCSECSSISSIYKISKIDNSSYISIGKPIYNTCIYILDPNLNFVSPFIEGEIYIGGAGVAIGYLDDAVGNSERFIPNPFKPETRLYRTGDYGRINPEGLIEFTGRKDRQLKIRGARMDCSEIEFNLKKVLGLKECAIILRGSGVNQHIIAFCTRTTDGLSPEPESTIRAQVLKSIPSAFVPAKFIFLNSLPLTLSGKIDRVLLAKKVVDDSRLISKNQTGAEYIISQIWKEVLKIDEVSDDDNFFLVGGHSLNMLQVIYRIKVRFDIEISIIEFQVNSTFRDLVNHISKSSDSRVRQSDNLNVIRYVLFDHTKPTLIMLHAFGGIAGYKELAKATESRLQILGLNAFGMFDISVDLPSSLEAAASDYLSLIIKQGLTGDIFVGGYSSSVPLAFEIVKGLEYLGIPIKKLFLFDDFFDASTKILSDKDKQLLLDSELSAAAENMLSLPAVPFHEGNDQDIPNVHALEEIRRFKQVVSNLFECQMRYTPAGAVKTNIVYFSSSDGKKESSWAKYANGRFEYQDLQGRHGKIFAAPNIDANSEKILNHLHS